MSGAATGCSGTLSRLTIGTVGEDSGIAASAVGGGPQAVQAWVSYINAHGGLACHSLRYVVADDGGDPAKNSALVQQLVEQDHVIAFVQMNAPLAGQASVNYINSKRVPVIGTEGASPWATTSPMYFPQGSSGDDFVGGGILTLADIGKQQGLTKLGTLVCIEATICSRTGQVVDQYAQRDNVQVVYKGTASLTAPDFTSQCLAAKNAGVQMLLADFEYTGLERVAHSCNSVNYHPLLGTVGEAAAPALTSDAEMNGLVFGTNVIPWFQTSVPSIALFNQVLTQYAPGVTPDASTVQGWVSAQLFALAAQDLPANPTSADVLRGLWKIKNNDLGGLTGPITFTENQPTSPRLCYWQIGIKASSFYSPNSAQRVCR